MAKATPFRFSTKYQDGETDLLYYGYRYYDASTGRWLTGDPIGQQGGKNLYAFTTGDSVNFFDFRGLKKKCGVDKFQVRYLLKPTSTVEVPDALFYMEIDITFKQGGDYDPKCCQYRQNVMTKYRLDHPGRSSEWFDNSPLHYDFYSRASDTDGNPGLNDPHFHTSDAPGVGGLGPDDEFYAYEFTAEQIVYAPGRDLSTIYENCDCEKNKEIAKKGPHTVKVYGKRGNYRYEGLPVDL